jgi:hypothetical protein
MHMTVEDIMWAAIFIVWLIVNWAQDTCGQYCSLPEEMEPNRFQIVDAPNIEIVKIGSRGWLCRNNVTGMNLHVRLVWVEPAQYQNCLVETEIEAWELYTEMVDQGE